MCLSICVSTLAACVKDLIRALRADDSRCEIRRELGRARVLQQVLVFLVELLECLLIQTCSSFQDLLSILVSSPDDHTLRNDVIRSVT